MSISTHPIANDFKQLASAASAIAAKWEAIQAYELELKTREQKLSEREKEVALREIEVTERETKLGPKKSVKLSSFELYKREQMQQVPAGEKKPTVKKLREQWKTLDEKTKSVFKDQIKEMRKSKSKAKPKSESKGKDTPLMDKRVAKKMVKNENVVRTILTHLRKSKHDSMDSLTIDDAKTFDMEKLVKHVYDNKLATLLNGMITDMSGNKKTAGISAEASFKKRSKKKTPKKKTTKKAAKAN